MPVVVHGGSPTPYGMPSMPAVLGGNGYAGWFGRTFGGRRTAPLGNYGLRIQIHGPRGNVWHPLGQRPIRTVAQTMATVLAPPVGLAWVATNRLPALIHRPVGPPPWTNFVNGPSSLPPGALEMAGYGPPSAARDAAISAALNGGTVPAPVSSMMTAIPPLDMSGMGPDMGGSGGGSAIPGGSFQPPAPVPVDSPSLSSYLVPILAVLAVIAGGVFAYKRWGKGKTSAHHKAA